MDQRILSRRLPKLGFSHFPRICSHRRLDAEPPMGAKVHKDVFELVFISHGMQYRACNGFNYPLSGGQSLLIKPGQRHSTGIMPQGTGHVYWLHIKKLRAPLLNMSHEESKAVFEYLSSVEKPILVLGKSGQIHFESLFDLLLQKPCSAIDTISIRQHLLGIIQLCLHAEQLGENTSPKSSLQQLALNPKLYAFPAALAKEVGLSLSRLRARCKEEFGISLGDYLLHLRVEDAMKCILQHPNRSITDIALELHFSSSQYFATVFKRYTAMSPSEFRRNIHSPEGRRKLIKLGLIET